MPWKKRSNRLTTGQSPLEQIEEELRRIVQSIGRTAIAFSGGADSSLLLKVALDELGAENILAVSVRSCLLKSSEIDRAVTWPDRQGLSGKIRLEFVDASPLGWDDFVANPADRCYLCKSKVYRIIMALADKSGFASLIDGTNFDDMNSTRPGLRALKELGIRTPLADAGLTKEDVRQLSRKLELDTWNHPSASCLATRIPAGRKITEQRLQLVDRCEAELERFGFAGCRFRLDSHDDSTGYVQVMARDLGRLADRQLVENIKLVLRDAGMEKIYVDLDCR